MEEIVVFKGVNNSLHPATEEDAAKIAKYKLGSGVRLKSTKMSEHNLKFHQKVIMLFKVCYEAFTEGLDTGVEYRGQKVQPSESTFREQLTVLAGWYNATYNIDGSVRLRAKSIAYNNMSDTEKEKLFSDVINAALRHVYRNVIDETKLRSMVEQLLAFDR
jgi:hypothetical protein